MDEEEPPERESIPTPEELERARAERVDRESSEDGGESRGARIIRSVMRPGVGRNKEVAGAPRSGSRVGEEPPAPIPGPAASGTPPDAPTPYAQPDPRWATSVPIYSGEDRVRVRARELAAEMGLPYIAAVRCRRPPQGGNPAVFEVGNVRLEPVLLVAGDPQSPDAATIAEMLRAAGVPEVFTVSADEEAPTGEPGDIDPGEASESPVRRVRLPPRAPEPPGLPPAERPDDPCHRLIGEAERYGHSMGPFRWSADGPSESGISECSRCGAIVECILDVPENYSSGDAGYRYGRGTALERPCRPEAQPGWAESTTPTSTGHAKRGMWLTCVPFEGPDDPMLELARAVATELGIEFVDAVDRASSGSAGFRVEGVRQGSVILFAAKVSAPEVTVVAALLRDAGVPTVFVMGLDEAPADPAPGPGSVRRVRMPERGSPRRAARPTAETAAAALERADAYGHVLGEFVTDHSEVVVRQVAVCRCCGADVSFTLEDPTPPTRSVWSTGGAAVEQECSAHRSTATAVAALHDRRGRVTVAAYPGDLTGLDGVGLCAFWCDALGAAELTAGLGVRVEPGLLYVGQAGATTGSGVTSEATLRSRIHDQHLHGHIGGSTFRYSLAAALRIPLQLEAIGRGRLAASAEATLSDWMRRRLSLSVHGYGAPGTLQQVTLDVIACLDPSFNLKGVPESPIRQQLRRRRRDLG